MPRPKLFERDEVLEKAMQVFWSKGYDATSVQDLVDAMGINRGSLYDTFGDKRDLYLAALDRYCRTRTGRTAGAPSSQRSAQQSAQQSAKAEIEDIFRVVADSAADFESRRGCFLCNTAIEICPGDQEMAEKVRQGFAFLEARLVALVSHGQAHGEFAARHSPDALARYLVSSLNGLRVMIKCDNAKDRIDDIVGVTLSSLYE